MSTDEGEFYRLAQRAAAADRDVIDMVSGDPDWGPPPGVATGLRRYADRLDEDPTEGHYPPSEGLDSLRGAVATRRNVPKESIVITHGTTEAIYLMVAAALARSDGDEVLFADPYYPYYPAQVDLLDGVTRTVPAGPDGHLDPTAVRKKASAETACIIVNTPNNPTGAVLDANTMADLVEIAAEFDTILVSDETYDHLVLDGPYASALAVDSAYRAVATSVSKSLAITGFRVGIAIVPPTIADEVRRRHLRSTVAASRPAQAAVAHALAETGPEHYASVRDLLNERVDSFATPLEAAGATVQRPEGSFYVLVNLPGWEGTMSDAEALIEQAGVAGMPGETFGGLSDWVRFALVTPRVETAAERLAAVC